MLKNKQFLYYSRLCVLGVRQDIAITLDEVAEAMFTSSRHCRTLLREMQALGWLAWSPKVGRNQRSGLYLNYSLPSLKAEIAQSMIAEGKYERALALIDNDQALFGQLLKKTSGTNRREGRLHIQLTYTRAFSPLLPHYAARNSERFFLRQIYSCLTQCDAFGNVTADLAHHWAFDENTLQWRFYLRPQLVFDDGSELDATTVAALFSRLKQRDVYRQELEHVVSIEAVSSQCVVFTLNQSDWGFAGLLADVRYAIQPVSQLEAAPTIVGSGVFRVQEHSGQRLKLEANGSYHGYRALADTVSIWQVPAPLVGREDTKGPASKATLDDAMVGDGGTCANYLSLSGSKAPDHRQRSRLEDGCLLALVNRHADLNVLQRRYLAQLFASDELVDQFRHTNSAIDVVPAYNLLPQWLKVASPCLVEPSLPARISIGIYRQQALQAAAQTVLHLLAQVGVQCDITVYAFDEFSRMAQEGALREDLLITSLNFDDNRPSSAFRWMLSNPVLYQCLASSEIEWLRCELTRIRQTQKLPDYLDQLEVIATALIADGRLLPIFHHQQVLNFDDVLKGVAINVWGWPELRDVWSED
ncbi:peptide-binding protein [Photobacterium aquae]|uniref:Peptide-binding protein n=1 Tax=Photobacterium aquae TaxID=1195763 RepID=A0A0J1GU11_9GAMM|nr:peptide-binding protein [Photobacterium aquae]